MSEVESRIAVDYLDASGGQSLSRFLILSFAAASRWIQHHAHGYPSALRVNHRFQEIRIREREHFDAQRLLRSVDGVENRFGRIIGENNQRMGHPASNGCVAGPPIAAFSPNECARNATARLFPNPARGQKRRSTRASRP